ncbi:MAG: carbamate kinase [Thermodesulfovibrionales bacterium]
MSMSSESTALIALGGNALILAGEKGYIEEQFNHADACMKHLAGLISQGMRVVITHGNGPIVGNILLRNECAKDYIPPMPLYICVADSQGGIGAMMAQSLRNQLKKLGIATTVLAMITHALVDKADPAFQDPSKPIGPYYSDAAARSHRESDGWVMRKVRAKGWRRLVPSPIPHKIIEREAIRSALDNGMIAIASGGGGIPVIEENGILKGVDAVIDKDHSASLLARELGLKRLIILTDVDGVYLNWNNKKRKRIERLSLDDARRYLREGQFPPGDMGPKIEAAIAFIASGGEETIIAQPEEVAKALSGRAGTRISAS